MITITLTIRWKRWALLLALIVVGGGGLGYIVDRLVTVDIYVEGHRMLRDEVTNVRQILEGLTGRTIQIGWDDELRQFDPRELGVRADIEAALSQALAARSAPFQDRFRRWLRDRKLAVHVRVPVNVDHEMLRDQLLAAFDGIETESIDARLLSNASGGGVMAGKPGRMIDLEALSVNLASALWADEQGTVSVPFMTVEPRIRIEELAGWKKLHVVGEAVTTFDSTQKGRTENIRLGAKTLDGIVLLPGHEFSFNLATGERTAAIGYREAPVIVDGELVPGIGGGVSQLASTVYNAALTAGLHVIEYHSHSQPVPYLPLGLDATVWYGQLDLRFVNTLEYPIVVNTETGTDWVRVEIRSPHRVDQRVEIKTEVIDHFPPPIDERLDHSLSPEQRRLLQPGRPGQRVALIQTVYEGEQIIATRRLEAVYRPQAEIWAVASH